MISYIEASMAVANIKNEVLSSIEYKLGKITSNSIELKGNEISLSSHEEDKVVRIVYKTNDSYLECEDSEGEEFAIPISNSMNVSDLMEILYFLEEY